MNTTLIDFQRDVLDASMHTPVLVDFWAEWCGPCRVLGPVLEALDAEAGGRWKLVKLNTELQPDIAQAYRIMSIPAVKLFDQGKVRAEFVGALPKSQILQWLHAHLPDPRMAQLEALRQSGAAGLAALEGFAAAHPDLPEARLALAEALLFSDPERAVALAASLPPAPGAFDRVEDLRTLAELAAFEPDAAPVALKLAAAREALRQGDDESVLRLLVEAVAADKSYRRDLPRKAILAMFRRLGDDHLLTRAYRSKFNMALY